MRITSFIFLIALILSPLPAHKALAEMAVQVKDNPDNQGFGDPDSESAPLVTEPDSAQSGDDDGGDGKVADKATVTTNEALPGAHLVEPETTELLPADAANDEGDKWHEMKLARLQGLNKVTARTIEIKANINTPTKFGNLELNVEKCARGPENEKAENAVLLTVWDKIPGQDKKQVFHGWMFSSSPAISALEHPIYDIVLLGCGEAPKPAPAAAPDAKNSDAKKPKAKKPVT